ncbi:MAG TPA: cytochrome B [Candidatus Omnitrophica bacterium]|nr:cytochrome B [Candidatus Omnitrophota bacterium]
MKKSKAKVAFFDFTDCEGCQLQIVNLNTVLLDILEHIEIVNFREAMSEPRDDYDIAVIEGSISTEHDIKRITGIRKQAKVVIALGACATIGGVNAIKNRTPLNISLMRVYKDKADKFKTIAVKPIDQVIKVDYYIHGCPVHPNEVAEVFKCLLLGKKYDVPNYPVCVECKMNENVCLYQKEQNCMGPVTRAGCNSWCVNNGNICYGCRGLIDNPANDAQNDILANYGLDVNEIIDKFTLYTAVEKKYVKEIKE